MGKSLLLLDLDGTVRRPIEGEWCKGRNQELFPGVKELIKDYKKTGSVVYGITNQGGVHYGHKTFAECAEEQRITARRAGLDKVFFCPNLGESCYEVSPLSWFGFGIKKHDALTDYRKPGAGMLITAINYFFEYHYPELADGMVSMTGVEGMANNVFRCLMSGDRQEDCDAALSLYGCSFQWANEWRSMWDGGL